MRVSAFLTALLALVDGIAVTKLSSEKSTRERARHLLLLRASKAALDSELGQKKLLRERSRLLRRGPIARTTRRPTAMTLQVV